MKARLTVLAAVALLVPALVFTAGCRKKHKEAKDEETHYSESELWDTAQGYLKDEKWKKAGDYLKLLVDQYPTGVHVREAQILYADTLYNRGSDANLIEAQAKYMAYVAFYPEDDRAAYAAFRVALCNYERRAKPDRDQAVTRDAINELEKVIQSYPKSTYADDAKPIIRQLRDELALHEYKVARFYSRRGFDTSVVKRMKFLLEKYPEYGKKDEVYFLLAENLMKQGNAMEAKIYLEKLTEEYPGSDLKKDAEDLLDDARKQVGEDAREAEKKDEKDEKKKGEKASEPEMKMDAPHGQQGQQGKDGEHP
ncbi:MAG: outer membrane protein assembly factor BamD [Acidobacteriota bacterium]